MFRVVVSLVFLSTLVVRAAPDSLSPAKADPLPRNPAGKLLKAQLRKRFVADANS